MIPQNHFNFLIQRLRSCYPLKKVKIGESILSFFNASSEFLIWGIGRFRGHYIFNNFLIFYFEIQENDFEENLLSHAKSFTYEFLKFEADGTDEINFPGRIH